MLQPPKGTRDLLPEVWEQYRRVFRAFEECLREYNFGLVELPLFESTQLFQRTLGEGTDISKEMYTFKDRSGDSLSLRPEGTASLVRAYIGSPLAQRSARLAYAGPMFRYERPQKGRYRQFYQLGVEALGYSSGFDDVELLALGHRFLQKLGLNRRTTLEVNTLGDGDSRKAYLNSLVNYFEAHRDRLSKESQNRLTVNPLRILDSKQEADQEFLKGAPQIKDYLTPASVKHWDEVLKGLQHLNIPYVVNPLLVRGLDYYNHTVFEFTTQDLGSQNAVLSGGRYDGLVKTLGGNDTPAVGWAAGWDRLALLLEPLKPGSLDVAILPLDGGLEVESLLLAQRVRSLGASSEIVLTGNMSKKLKKASKLGAQWAWMLGRAEAQEGVVLVKNLETGDQKSLTVEAALTEWKSL